MNWKTHGSIAVVAVFAFALIGCGDGGRHDATKAKGGTTTAKSETKHDGWWCDEHGIPEAECSMCSAKVAKECKAKGDWCELHDRAKSQCFICDPKLKEKYSAMYRAKYGKEPPPTEDEGKGKKDSNGK